MTAPEDRPAPVEAVDLSHLEGSGGVVWSVSPEGFHTNLVVLGAGDSIAAHRNDEVDVLVVVLAGETRVEVDGQAVDAAASRAVLVPRGATRSITAGAGGARYLTTHARRGPLTIDPREGARR